MHKVKMTTVRFICATHEFEISDDEYNDLMDCGATELKLVHKLGDMIDKNPTKYVNADYMFEVDGNICEPFCDGFLDEIKCDVEELMNESKSTHN